MRVGSVAEDEFCGALGFEVGNQGDVGVVEDDDLAVGPSAAHVVKEVTQKACPWATGRFVPAGD